MDIFELMKHTNNNEVIFFEEPSVNLRLIIAINDTTLGPAIANSRIEHFGNIEDASKKALSMAYYNTYRAALLHKGFGGAGISLCGNPELLKDEMYLRTLGIVINKQNGRINLVRSSGMSQRDMLNINRETNYLLGIDEKYILSNNSPLEVLTRGMSQGIKAIVRKKLDADSLNGFTFVVQGLGEIGSYFVEELLKLENAKIIITDLIYDKIKVIQDKSNQVKVVKPTEIYNQKCDFFISCAYDNIIDKEAAEKLDCKVLTGSSNEMLSSPEIEEILIKKGILYVPGFVINGAELIAIDNETKKNSPEIIEKQLHEIYDCVWNLIELSEKNKQTIKKTALEIADNYLNAVAQIKKLK